MNLLSLDNQIFAAIYSLSGQSFLLDWFGIFCARYLIWIMIAVFFIWWLELARTKPSRDWPVLGKRKWVEIGSALLSITWAIILNQLLSLMHFRSRPFVSKDVVTLVDFPYSIKSFPSDHATVVFALAVAIFFYNKKMGIIFLLMSLLVGLGRIYVGVHYPFDIGAGILVGVVAALMVRWIFLKTILKK